jgi:hypothetical protein
VGESSPAAVPGSVPFGKVITGLFAAYFRSVFFFHNKPANTFTKRTGSFTVLARVARIGSARTNWMAALLLLTNGHSYATVARGYDPSPFPQATTTKLEAS